MIFEKKRLKDKKQNIKKYQKENEADEWSGFFLSVRVYAKHRINLTA